MPKGFIWLPILIVFILGIALTYIFLAKPHSTFGEPMLPFKRGELVLSESVSYLFKEPEIGDRILFVPTGTNTDYVGAITEIKNQKDIKTYIARSSGKGEPWEITRDKIKRRIYYPFISSNEVLKVITSQLPTPTPNQVSKTDEITNSDLVGANWKTYTKLGYEIKYPQSSVITEYGLDSALPDLLSSTSTEIMVDGRQASVLFLVSVWKNLGVNITDTSSRDKWCGLLQNELTGQLDCFYEGKLPLVQVNGYNAYQAT